jgi:hypothetical protein
LPNRLEERSQLFMTRNGKQALGPLGRRIEHAWKSRVKTLYQAGPSDRQGQLTLNSFGVSARLPPKREKATEES